MQNEAPRERYSRVRNESGCDVGFSREPISRTSQLTAAQLRDYLRAQPFFDHASLTAEQWPIYRALRTAVRKDNDARCAAANGDEECPPMYTASCPDVMKHDLGRHWRPLILKGTDLKDWPWSKGTNHRDEERETFLRNGLVLESCMWGVVKWVAEREGIDASAESSFWDGEDPSPGSLDSIWEQVMGQDVIAY